MVVTPPDQAESRLARRKRMVAEMSNVRTLKWVGVALVLHIILIVATSIPYLRAHLSGRHEAEAMEDSKATPAAVAAPATDKPAAQTPAAPAVDKTAAAPATPSAAGLSEDEKKMAEMKNNPEVKKLTGVSKPGELPKTPSLKGIDDNP